MQDIPAVTKTRGPSSRVLQEVIRQAPSEYVTVGWLTSNLHRLIAPALPGAFSMPWLKQRPRSRLIWKSCCGELPKIPIVRGKLLTGYDAPVLYAIRARR